MEPFWIIVCIICVPLLFLGAPYIAMFLTLIPIQIIGFFGKIVDFFKDQPTSKNSTSNPPKIQEPSKTTPDKKASPSAQSQKPLSPPQKSDALKDIDFQQIVKSPSFDGARDQISQLYKEKQKEEEQRSKTTLIAVGVSLFVFVVILIGIASS